MNEKVFTISIVVSAFVGLIVASALCLFLCFFIYKPHLTNGTPEPKIPEEPTLPEEADLQPPTVRVHISAVDSITLLTDYTGFYQENSHCGKSYNELTDVDDKYNRETSPCKTNLSFDRQGNATKTVEIKSYDKAAKRSRITEKSAWKAKITAEQFDFLVKSISAAGDFIQWTDNVTVERFNSTITANHKNGVKQIQCYVDKPTDACFPMIYVFKNLDDKIKWDKV